MVFWKSASEYQLGQSHLCLHRILLNLTQLVLRTSLISSGWQVHRRTVILKSINGVIKVTIISTGQLEQDVDYRPVFLFSCFADQIMFTKRQVGSPSVFFASFGKTFSGMFGIIGRVLRSVSNGSIWYLGAPVLQVLLQHDQKYTVILLNEAFADIMKFHWTQTGS